MTHLTMIPKTAKNKKIPLRVRLEVELICFIHRHETGARRFFRFIDSLPFQTLGLCLVWLGTKFMEHGINAVELADKETGVCALILIPIGLYLLLRDWPKILK